MDNMLWPLKVAVAWVMVRIHDFLVLIGFPEGAGVAWVLSIFCLTIFMRIYRKSKRLNSSHPR